MYRLFISVRYLLHKRICILAMLGVAVGVMALVVTHSVMTGFEQNIRRRIRGALSDLIIEKYGEDYFGDYEALMARLSRIPHVQAVAPRLDGLALIKLGRHDEYRYAQFMGIDLERELQVSDLEHYWRNVQEARRQKNAEYVVVPTPTWRRPGAEAEGGEESEAVSPAIVGNELIVRGQDPEGNVVKLKPGDTIVMVTATSAFERGILPCRITDTFKSGMYEYDQRNVYIPLERAQEFLEQEGKVSAIHVRVDDYARVHEVRAAILGIPTLEEIARLRRLLRAVCKGVEGAPPLPEEDVFAELRRSYYAWRDTANPRYIRGCLRLAFAYGALAARLQAEGRLETTPEGREAAALFRELDARRRNGLGHAFRVSTWEDKRRNFLRAVDVERILIVVILSFFFLLGGFTIYAILSAMVLEKTKDIGTLKSLGSTVGGIMSIFLMNGLVIGLVGSALGTLGGVLFCRHINGIADLLLEITGRSVFPRDIYYLDRIPVDQDPAGWILTVASAALLTSVLASLLPAFRAARLDPVEALRYE